MYIRSVELLQLHLLKTLTVGRVTSHHVGMELKRPSIILVGLGTVLERVLLERVLHRVIQAISTCI